MPEAQARSQAMVRPGIHAGAQINIALVHYPVHNRRGEIIGSAVTNLDIHDIARISRTYGINRFYLVTPYQDQQRLVAELLAHWLSGRGGELNPTRKAALELVKVVPDLATLYAELGALQEQSHQISQRPQGPRNPLILATSAMVQSRTMAYDQARQRLAAGDQILILFGTASGLAPAAMAEVDAFLPPIDGVDAYNYLPVRAAVAIILDRLLRSW